jgi:4-carboxymuconolactone decarboxylase
MSDDTRRARGLAKFNEVYCGDVPAPPEGALDFFDLMLEQVFAEVWTREALSMRDRRLITMGVIAALGEGDTFGIQARAALKNRELTPEQLREMLIHLASYAGYPRTAGLIGIVEQAIAKVGEEAS